MHLAFNLLLTLLVELPIISFFFVKRKRKPALMVGLFVNLLTWPLVNIIRLNTDWNLDIVQIAVVIVEGAGYWLFLGHNLKKAAMIAVIANAVSFVITKFVQIPPDFFQKKVDIPIR